MKTNYTHITLVLDRSGSMETIRTDAIGGFNAFLADQQSAPGDATLTMIQFDDLFETVYNFAPLSLVQPLTEVSFVPRGSTALLDAIGMGIETTGERLAQLPESERPSKVIFVTLTDGMENASRKYAHKQILDKIAHQRDTYSWIFVFLAANQDAISTGATMGFQADNSATFVATSGGQLGAMNALSNATRRARSRSMTESSAPFFDSEDRSIIERGNRA